MVISHHKLKKAPQGRKHSCSSSGSQTLFLSLGTLSLYVGDVEFAVHTYKRRLKRMYGPILSAGGQLLIAVSTFS